MVQEKNLAIGAILIMAATPLISHKKCMGWILASRVSYTLSLGRGWVAAIVYRGPMAKFFSRTISLHDFELYPFDRELSYDFSK